MRCGNMNFARRDKCYKCGRPKPRQDPASSVKQVGKDFAEKSRGLFNPDDWECKGCGNVNWARRTNCNVCNAPKINTHGQRTGYGGGYMERDEVVDYKRHEDSDDEFDEFGLRKKKYRKNNVDGGAGDKPTEAKYSDEEEQISEERNEEEEESGDDEDLSKYDIVGDDDEVNEKPAQSSYTKNGDSKSGSGSSNSSNTSGDSSDSESSSSSTGSSSSSSSSESDSSDNENDEKKSNDKHDS
ncbi:unnamed protein product [Hymenolepis diminuta]|uniref:Zinc finger Ran-binding domain-containing protein 2 n=1 Tax=Hymenolepis diminuta TaxID=6216 RepID=A0A0R3SV92_HYMDI|nr:unnamed protein product [Hymenolepis diminuta]